MAAEGWSCCLFSDNDLLIESAKKSGFVEMESIRMRYEVLDVVPP